MAYRLDPRQPVGDEVRRVAAEQLSGAIAHLRAEPGPGAEDIHKTRTSLKKLRSLLRLVRDDLGSTAWRDLDVSLRDAGRALSGRRDADVVLETFESVSGRLDGQVDRDTFERVRRALAADTAAAGGATEADLVAEELDLIRLGVDDWSLSNNGFATIAPAVKRLHRRGRRAVANVGDGPEDELLHDLRKRAKDLWYQLRLLREVWPPVMNAMAAEAGELSDVLGDHHDLAVLGNVLTDRHTGSMGAGRDPLLSAIDDGRAELEGRARRLAAHLYADPPNVWTMRLDEWWNATVGVGVRSDP